MTPAGLATAALAILLLVGGMWVTSQAGMQPVSVGGFAASVQAIVKAAPLLIAIWLSAAGWGGALRRALGIDGQGQWVLSLTLGLAAWLLGCWLLGWAGWLNWWSAWGLTAAGAMLAFRRLMGPARREKLYPENWPSPPWTLLLGLPALGILAIAVTMPPGTLWSIEAFGYDVMLYHLQLPREWLANGAMRGLEHNVYSYLPNLVEGGYMGLGAMQGGVAEEPHVRTFQMFHATCALLTAAGIGQLVSLRAGRVAGVAAGVVFLCVPWTIITGSLAYNEMVVTAFAAGALLVVLAGEQSTWRHALLAGLLCGGATLAKLTAGPMVALPVAGIVVWRIGWGGQRWGGQRWGGQRWGGRPARHQAEGLSKAQTQETAHKLPLKVAHVSGAFLIGAMLMVGPYLVRNAIWTGNPVFPFAARTLGMRHWDESNVDRWEAAHSTDASPFERTQLLGRQWFFNMGYGSVGGREPGDTRGEVARFPLERGIPFFWGAVLLATVIAIIHRHTRGLSIALAVVLCVQLIVWLTLTHLQSRFLVPTLVPGCLLLGLGLGALRAWTKDARPWAFAIPAVALPAVMTFMCYIVLINQTLPQIDLDGRRLVRYPPCRYVDNIVEFCSPPLNTAIANANKLYIVADTQHLLYIRKPVTYRTPFDTSPIGAIIRDELDGQFDAAFIADELRRRGYTHIWFGWNELVRFTSAGNYGYDPDVTLRRMALLYQHLTGRVAQGEGASVVPLYREGRPPPTPRGPATE